jgi:hypothetical protein
MLPLEALLEGTFLFNIEVCPPSRSASSSRPRSGWPFCQMSGGDDKVDVSAMKTEVDQVTAEIFTEGARVYSARTHVITPAAVEGVINAFSRVGIEARGRERLRGHRSSSSRCRWPTTPTNDRTVKRGRRMLGLNLSHLLRFYGGLQGTPSPISSS